MKLLDNPEYLSDLGSSASIREIGTKWGIHHTTVMRHRNRLAIQKDPNQSVTFVPGESFEHRPDGTSDYVMRSDVAWGKEDIEKFLRSKGQDPDQVTYTWGVTSNPAGGFWNKLNNVRQKTEDVTGGLEVSDLLGSLREWTPKEYDWVMTPPEALVIGLADWQLGKAYEGDGTPQTVERLKGSLSNAVRHVEKLLEDGRNVRTLYLANLGDHIENVAGSYASQTYEVDLNLRDQIELAVELNMLWIQTLAPYFEEVIYTASPCNHAQLTRGQGKSNVTDDSDNATGMVAEFVRQLCALHDGLGHVEVQVPRGEMIQTLTLEGVNIATAHGHKIPSNEENWLSKQSQRLVHQERFITDIWFVAHRHSLAVNDYGPYTRIQATTVDPGSKWFTDSTGKYARPGTTSFIVGDHLPGKWDDLKIL